MAKFQFQKATKKQAKARIALIGPTGSGKTYTALKIGTALGDKVALIDTENRSASKYADEFEFYTLDLDSFSPRTYVEAIHAAEEAGFDVLIIDSLSHAWMGRDGALDLVDKAAKRYRNNTFAAWRDVTPEHNRLVDALVRCRCHLIVTMRSKTEYIIQEDEKGKKTPVKVGLAPIQREGLEYEFDVVGDMDQEHNLIISKTRCRALDGEVFHKPGEEVANILKAWLSDGEAVPEPQHPPKPEEDTVDFSKLRKKFFAQARELGISSDIAKEWAKQALSDDEKPCESFNDIPPKRLEATTRALTNSEKRKSFQEQVRQWYLERVKVDAMQLCDDETGLNQWFQAIVEKDIAIDDASLEDLEKFAADVHKQTTPPDDLPDDVPA